MKEWDGLREYVSPGESRQRVGARSMVEQLRGGLSDGGGDAK